MSRKKLTEKLEEWNDHERKANEEAYRKRRDQPYYDIDEETDAD